MLRLRAGIEKARNGWSSACPPQGRPSRLSIPQLPFTAPFHERELRNRSQLVWHRIRLRRRLGPARRACWSARWSGVLRSPSRRLTSAPRRRRNSTCALRALRLLRAGKGSRGRVEARGGGGSLTPGRGGGGWGEEGARRGGSEAGLQGSSGRSPPPDPTTPSPLPDTEARGRRGQMIFQGWAGWRAGGGIGCLRQAGRAGASALAHTRTRERRYARYAEARAP